MSTGDDPWAKWRKSDTAAAVDGEKTEKTPASDRSPDLGDSSADSAPARAPTQRPVRPAPSTDPASPAPAKPEGTLSVRRDMPREERPGRHKPLRGGPVSKRDLPPAKAVEKSSDNPWAKSAGRAASTTKPVRADRSDYSARDDRPARTDRPRTDRPVRKEASATPHVPFVRSGPPPEGTRLSKVMSERGMCSRREADLWIERGWVFVNGEQVCELGSRIDPSAEITISTEAKKDQAKLVTILLHKPVGYVSGQPEPGCIPAVTLITAETQMHQSGDMEFKPWMLRGLAPAGRLDIDSTGLLVLTSDGRVARKLVGDDSQAEKEYLVRVSGKMIPNGLDLLKHGLELDGKPLRPAWVKQLNEDQLHFILKEGKKRQIRRMCELVGLQVIGLKRVRIGRVRLGDLPMGQWRFLRADEAF
ncbi:pseudouridine synthase [Azonexus sp.]|uniref:pseudouridine synthase n=1 Tax=Azonexus sp. TaxID=1872668 RepID=UPI0027BA972A|nr:pseudouridine synthase [Azonexus sp.]